MKEERIDLLRDPNLLLFLKHLALSSVKCPLKWRTEIMTKEMKIDISWILITTVSRLRWTLRRMGLGGSA